MTRLEGEASRTSMARQVMDDYLHQRSHGGSMDPESVIAANEALRPELEIELRKLRLIESAREFVESRGGEGLDRPAARPARDAFPGYELLGELHRGGQGVVYRAIQEGTRQQVAIKVLRQGSFAGPRDQARFEREVHILGQLKHPNIVAIHESGAVGGCTYFVMDYIPGLPLDGHVAQHQLGIDETLHLFARVCDAVSVAHLRGVIHRDLKPSNIRVDHEGAPHVLDFGLAKATELDEAGDSPSEVATITGQFVGSLPWASPEQADGGAAGVDLRTDVYSLGVVLYQLLTGQFPYETTGPLRETMDRITTVVPARPSTSRGQINNEVDTIVLKCLSKEPARRYQSAAELAGDIRHYLAGEPIEAKRDSSWYVFRKTVRRYRVPVSLAVFFAVVVSGLAIGMGILYYRASAAEGLAATEAQNFEQALSSLKHVFEGIEPLPGGGVDLTIRQMLDQNAERVVDGLSSRPAAQVELMETVADVAASLGLVDSALKWRTRVAETHRGVLASDDVDVAESLHWLAKAQASGGNREQAERTFRKALEIRRSALGIDHPDTLSTQTGLAWLLHSRGEYDEPEQLYRDALSRLRQQPVRSATIVTAFTGFAAFLQNKGDYEEAEALLDEALGITAGLGESEALTHASVAASLATLLHDRSRYSEAEAHRRAQLAIYNDRYPDGHPSIVGTAVQLGLLLKDMARYDEAEPYLVEANERTRRLFGESHAATAYTQHSLAKLYTDAGNYDKAEIECRKALEYHLAAFPPDHRNVARPMTNLGKILVAQGRAQDAEPLLRRALVIRLETKPPGHWKTAKTKSILGAALAGQGLFEEAEPLVLEAYPDIVRDRGAAHRRTREAVQRIIDLYEAWERPDRAEAWRGRLQAR